MLSPELFDVLKKVLISWEVVAMTVVIVIFWSVVNSVMRLRKPAPKATRSTKPKKIKRPPPPPTQLDKNIDASDIGIGE
ncbi:MAG: hypothetical protein LBF83_07345 [Spirochaetaceae bacterium]|jgi:hypothetical protein|nr:hypothetical protein [Spirochaetaceae bacterium]